MGNLTELVIALAALRAGEYTLVKASTAGAIVTNTLLLLATIALLMASAIAEADAVSGAAVAQKLSLGLAVLLILAYGLGLLFSLKTHRDFFASAEHGERTRRPGP